MTQLEDDMKLQMPLFSTTTEQAATPPEPVDAPSAELKKKSPSPAPPAKTPQRKPTSGKALTPPRQPRKTPGERRISGLVPEGDVRLTANIRQDLHLRLKIAAAHGRTTIGEIIEQLVEKYIKP